ncbi:hypothetical protein [uncultured Parabacteroides sp.]|nr:hypothetical protein [uncultured Parabacteroides sp.]
MAATDKSVTDKRQTVVTSNEKALSLQHKIKDFELSQSPNAAPCLSNRVQLSTEIGERFLKTASRQFELSLQKEQDALNKISEIVLVTHSLKCSSLRIRAGHWVYVLRKIII